MICPFVVGCWGLRIEVCQLGVLGALVLLQRAWLLQCFFY